MYLHRDSVSILFGADVDEVGYVADLAPFMTLVVVERFGRYDVLIGKIANDVKWSEVRLHVRGYGAFAVLDFRAWGTKARKYLSLASSVGRSF